MKHFKNVKQRVSRQLSRPNKTYRKGELWSELCLHLCLAVDCRYHIMRSSAWNMCGRKCYKVKAIPHRALWVVLYKFLYCIVCMRTIWSCDSNAEYLHLISRFEVNALHTAVGQFCSLPLQTQQNALETANFLWRRLVGDSTGTHTMKNRFVPGIFLIGVSSEIEQKYPEKKKKYYSMTG